MEKARQLIQGSFEEFERAEKAEDEQGMRHKGSVACEKAFHALVELANAIIQSAGWELPQSHGGRAEALEDLNRKDLARFYREAKDVLHTEGHYEQRLGRSQRDMIREVQETVERELKKLE